MSAGIYKMLCEQGATLTLALLWKDGAGNPVDMTGFTAAMQVRKTKDADTAVLTLTTENGGILLDAQGNINLLASAEATSDISEGQYVYDLEINSGTQIVRLLEGAFVVSGEVTR